MACEASPSGPCMPAAILSAAASRLVSFAMALMSESDRGSSNQRISASTALAIMVSLGPRMPRSRTMRSIARWLTGTVNGFFAWWALWRVGATASLKAAGLLGVGWRLA